MVFDLEISKDSRKIPVKLDDHPYVLPNKPFETQTNPIKITQTNIGSYINKTEIDQNEDVLSIILIV